MLDQTRIPAVLLPAVSLLTYIIPLTLGYGWTALTAVPPLERSYVGRYNASPVTAEPWGAANLEIPMLQRLSANLRSGNWPLWNPDQGLGQQFLAQGDGNTLFPATLLRALLGYSLSNVVSVLLLLLTLWLLKRTLDSTFGKDRLNALFCAGLALAPAFTFNIGRFNLFDQTCALVLCGCIVHAGLRIQTQHSGSGTPIKAAMVVAAGFTILLTGGFIQIAVAFAFTLGLSATVLVIYNRSWDMILSRPALVLVSGFLGSLVLAWHFVGPVHDAIHYSYFKNTGALESAYAPSLGNFIALWLPLLNGPVLGSYQVELANGPVDWGNLYAVPGLTILIVSLSGLLSRDWTSPIARRAFVAVILTNAILLGFYFRLPPGDWIGHLPIVGNVTHKHVLPVVCMLGYAGTFLFLKFTDLADRRALMVGAFLALTVILIALIRLFQTGQLIWPVGLRPITDYEAGQAISLAIMTVLLVAAFGRHTGREVRQVAICLCLVVEGFVFLPMGLLQSNGIGPTAWQAAIGGVLCLALYAIFHTKPANAGLLLLTWGTLWGQFVAMPDVGLPNRHMSAASTGLAAFLGKQGPLEHRSFGIFPDHASRFNARDISVLGPFAPASFAHFVRIIADESTFTSFGSSEFMLARRRKVTPQLLAANRPIYDWLGVKYYVFDREVTSDTQIEDFKTSLGPETLSEAFRDMDAVILASHAARKTHAFTGEIKCLRSRAAIRARLKEDPERIPQSALIENIDDNADICGERMSNAKSTGTVELTGFSPNRRTFIVTNDGPGLIILKEAFYPGWTAEVDDRPARVVRVNGMVMGIFLERAGTARVTFRYMEQNFHTGLILAVSWLLLSLGLVACSKKAQFIHIPAQLVPAAHLISGAVLVAFILVTITPLRSAPEPRRATAADGELVAIDGRSVMAMRDYRPFAMEFRSNVIFGRTKAFPRLLISDGTQDLVPGDLLLLEGGHLYEVGERGELGELLGSPGVRVQLYEPSAAGNGRLTGVLVWHGDHWLQEEDMAECAVRPRQHCSRPPTSAYRGSTSNAQECRAAAPQAYSRC